MCKLGKRETVTTKGLNNCPKQIPNNVRFEQDLNNCTTLFELEQSTSLAVNENVENKTKNMRINIIQDVTLSPDLNLLSEKNLNDAPLWNEDCCIENMDILLVNDSYEVTSTLNSKFNKTAHDNNSFFAQSNDDNNNLIDGTVDALGSRSNVGENSVNETNWDNQRENDRILEDITNEVVADYGNMSAGRKKRKIAEPKMWDKTVNKKLRMEGKEYVGYTRKNKVVKHNTIRKARKIGPACTSSKCATSKNKMCKIFPEETRKKLFDNFWNETNWDQRKIFVSSHVEKQGVQRKTTHGESRRNYSLKYTLPLQGQKLQVCQRMFLNTLSIGEFTVQSWVRDSNYCNMIPYKEKSNSKRNVPLKEEQTIQMKFLNNFLDELPKLPSHYNRANTSKLYLEPIIRNMKELTDIYKRQCHENNVTPLSRQVFTRKVNEKNISLHKSKKDKCDICVQHEVGNLEEAEWLDHRNQRERAREEKCIDKTHSNEGACITLTMDLEAVKLAPCINASSIYFKTKLACHNFTVYDLNSHEATCYWFNETDTDLSASTFVSCLIDYLMENCIGKDLPIVIYSDGCTYQNRNSIMANALLNLVITKDLEIIQKYLVPGHTQMECDSVHSCIERKLKTKEIYLPSDYIKATKEARQKPFPYKVKEVDHTLFKNYDDRRFIKFASIRPGRKRGDPTVTDIKVIAYNYEKSGNIQVKLGFDEEFQYLPTRATKLQDTEFRYDNLYKIRRPIKAAKWIHLQQLKSELPKDCHYFYDQLSKE